MTRWYVASLADGDTHLAEPSSPGPQVSAHCNGKRFHPLAILRGVPPDKAQVCPACQTHQAGKPQAPARVDKS
ncbi:MAG: hypothetical protein ACRDTG_21765 [Pseudonocardiaceae bacterium]